MLRDFKNECFDIIIQGGQSNAEGCGIGPTDHPYWPKENVLYYNNDFTISRAREIVSGNNIQSNFVLSFAREYVNNGLLAEGRKLLIIRAAVGGTGFLDNHWGMQDDHYLRMMEMIKDALAFNPENRIVAFLWHQGEADAILGASKEAHYNNLMTLVKSVRSTFNIENVPFIAGDFVQHWKSEHLDIATPVVDAIRDVCRDCGGGFVETDGLLSNLQEHLQNGTEIVREDTIHFSRRAGYELGLRYFDCFMKLRNK